MFLPENQIWWSWAAEHDFAIVMEELIRLPGSRFLSAEPKAAPAHDILPAEVGGGIDGCTDSQKPLGFQKKDQVEVTRGKNGKQEFPESSDMHQAEPVAGHAQNAAGGLCVDIGWLKIPKRKSFRAKVAGVLQRGSASGGDGGSFACLSSAELLDAQETEPGGEEEESPQRLESLGSKNSKLRKRKVRRHHTGATKAIQHQPAPAAKASGNLLLLDQTPSGAPASWADSNGRSKQWRSSGGRVLRWLPSPRHADWYDPYHPKAHEAARSVGEALRLGNIFGSVLVVGDSALASPFDTALDVTRKRLEGEIRRRSPPATYVRVQSFAGAGCAGFPRQLHDALYGSDAIYDAVLLAGEWNDDGRSGEYVSYMTSEIASIWRS